MCQYRFFRRVLILQSRAKPKIDALMQAGTFLLVRLSYDN